MKRKEAITTIVFVAVAIILALGILARIEIYFEGEPEMTSIPTIKPPVVETATVQEIDKPTPTPFVVPTARAIEKTAFSEAHQATEQAETEHPEPEPTPEPEMKYLGQFQCYGYDICIQCCGKTDGITASGTKATVGRTVASNDFPFGTVLYIEGLGYRTVEDRGGMASGVLDILCEDHPACYAITGVYQVYLVED